MVQLDRPQMKTIRRMGFACWVTKATDTHSEYVRLIAFHCASLLRCTCTECLSCIIFIAQFLEPNKCSALKMDSDIRDSFISANY